MFRISRIRMAGVGPADARFDKPSPDAPPFEISCEGAGGEPADSVIWLENGGGKTVFLSLLFHVLRPDRAAQIGNDDQGGRRADIGDFIIGSDVAHVVCEWVANDSDERILTGLVADRRGANVNRTWYLVAIRDGALSLDDLVFDVDGRRVPAARYIESLEQAASKAGKTGRRNRVEVTKTSVQRTWFEVLGDHDLDPALFEYQVRMNRSEGGVTSLFRFPSAERFVEFFLQLTMNPDTITRVSDELSRVAEKVASLPRKELQLAHATGAVERLTTLHGSWSDFEQARRDATAARASAETLHDRLHAAVVETALSLEEAERRVSDIDEERSRLDRNRREADTRSKIANIALAEERVAALRGEVDEAVAAGEDAVLTATAWPRLNQHQRRASLDSQIGEVRGALERADRDAAPLRERRDAVLRALRRELTGAVETARASMLAAKTDLDIARDDEKSANDSVREAQGRISEIRGLLTGLTRDIELHARAIDRAVADGIIARNDGLADTLSHARAQADELATTISTTTEERKAIARELPDLRAKAKATAGDAADVERHRAAQQLAVDTASETRRQLAAHPLLAELGAEGSNIELVGADLVQRINDEANRQRGDAIAVEAGAAEDRRAADHLERDRLLPARAEVDILCRLLHDHGVTTAVPGWRYLVESVPAATHGDVIGAHPDVADGIVVADKDLDRARALLTDASPSAAVLVTTSAAIIDGAERSVGWVVPPAAAMHDRSAAEAELARRHEHLAETAERTEAIGVRERNARVLASALDEHLAAWPTGVLPAATELAAQLASAARAAAEHAEAAAAGVTAAEDLIVETDWLLEGQRSQHSTLERRTGRLEQLVASAERSVIAGDEAEQLGAERGGLVVTVAAQQERLADATERIEAARRRHETAERAADAAGDQLSGLPDPGPGVADAATDIAGLRSAYDSAVALVAQATTDSELARRLEDLNGERGEVERDWASLDSALRARVETIAATPEAADPGARRKAEADAVDASSRANDVVARTKAKLDIATTERRKLPDPEPTWQVESFDIPAALDQLERFAADLAAAFETSRHAAASIRETLATANATRDVAAQAQQSVSVQSDALGSTLGERTIRDATPFDGDAGDAGDAVRTAMRRMNDTAGIRDRADETWRSDAHALGVFARDDRWKALQGELSRRLRDDQPDDLARFSGELLNQTRILESRLSEDIARLDTHRQVLVTSLGDAVSEAARGLRSARKKSELPDGLGEWSRQPFLKIGIDLTSDRAERDGRLRRFTNDLLERAAAAKGSLPTGADLICQAVLACAERAVTVDVLKPNKAQRLRYVPITETPTLSGGMRATAAIAMFCTLAKVRAANRTGRIGVGTLVLDNPLGDANATYLVALQRLVAQMNDVQLIYTTGVNDMDALRLFPVVTRLTNEVGKRSHLAYVVADEAFLKRLAPADGDDAVITGTRLVRRTAPILTTDLAAMAGDDE